MPIEVTARHIHVDVAMQEHARNRANALAEEFSRIEHIHVILDKEKHQSVAEIVVQAKNHIRVEAEEAADDLRAAIDLAVDKAEKQLRKLRDKIQEHRGRTHAERVRTGNKGAEV